MALSENIGLNSYHGLTILYVNFLILLLNLMLFLMTSQFCMLPRPSWLLFHFSGSVFSHFCYYDLNLKNCKISCVEKVTSHGGSSIFSSEPTCAVRSDYLVRSN